jgi:hypothetical protein
MEFDPMSIAAMRVEVSAPGVAGRPGELTVSRRFREACVISSFCYW